MTVNKIEEKVYGWIKNERMNKSEWNCLRMEEKVWRMKADKICQPLIK